MLASIFSLLLGVGILLTGTGFLFTLLGVRAGIEGFSDSVTGLIMSAYYVGFALGTYICPSIIRRAGHVRAFAAMASIASTMPVFHVLIVGPISWAVLRMITGLCLVGLYMVIESWLNTLASNETRGRIFSSYMTVTLVTQALGQYLILVGGIRTFEPFGLISILLSIALVPVTLTRVLEPKPVQTPSLQASRLFQLAPLGTIGAFTSGLINGAFWGMSAIYAFRMGLSHAGVAEFVSAAVLGGALLQWPIGRYSDGRDRRHVLAVVGLSAAVLAMIAYGFAYWSPIALIACTFLYGGLAFTVYGLSVAHVNDFLQPEEVLEGTRTLLLLNGLGAIVGPALSGQLMDLFGPGSLFLYFAAILALFGGYGLIRRRAPIELARQTEFVPMGTSSATVVEMDPRTETALEDAA
ncbi:MAG TPA: MFS transporter [Burkholderiales bacterium]|nr:MFS transporter [Burkholderiales bacterium]